MADVKKKKWRKILYKKQDYPDNYLDEEQFKKDLKINLNAKYYNISECIQGSIIVTQETGSIFLYINIFWLMEDNVLSPQYISSFLFLSMISLWSVATLTRANTIQLSSQLIDHVQQFSLFLFFLIGTSPILKTLTESISTDTIWTLAVY
jgi:phosphatidylinositol glycan class C protein